MPGIEHAEAAIEAAPQYIQLLSGIIPGQSLPPIAANRCRSPQLNRLRSKSDRGRASPLGLRQPGPVQPAAVIDGQERGHRERRRKAGNCYGYF